LRENTSILQLESFLRSNTFPNTTEREREKQRGRKHFIFSSSNPIKI
jgi:hypothetical protein